MTGLIVVLCVVFAMIVVSGVYVFAVACIRRKELPWLVEAELQKTPCGKYSKQILAADRWLTEHDAQNVYITSGDGLKLHARWVPAVNPRGTVIFAHGYRSSPLLDFGLALSFYYAHGLNILLPDQRAHGKSEGRIITFGVMESNDMESWISYHNKQFGALPVLLSGLSMGASTMLYLADRDLSANVKGIIADCGFTSPHEILASVFRDVIHLWATPTIYVTELCARCFGHFSLWQRDTRNSLASARIPVLMVHGKADDFVPCEMTIQGYQACTGPKQMFLVDGAEHGVSFLVETERYTQLIETFLADNLFKGE